MGTRDGRRRSRLRVALVSLLSIVLVLALAGALFVTWTVRRSFPQRDGTATLPGLGAQVTVHRDERGVPQLYADTADDLFRAQGFVHAQDRFWEMDFRRHVTAGRLSELFGADQLETDEFVRTLGWRRVAEQELDLLNPQTVSWLQAYAAGVNAYLADRSGSELSLEHGLLRLTNRGYQVEDWTPADSVAWLKAMAWDLRSNIEQELSRARLARTLSREQVEQLFPAYPFDEHPTIVPGELPGPDVQTAPDAARALPREAGPALDRVRRAVDAVPELLGPPGSGLGSNSWVVSGEHTASGMPLLANDPHLGPSLPSIWAQMGLHCTEVTAACPFDVAGFTFSGLPGVVIGHNAEIAWGFTNLAPDVGDLVLEKVQGDTYEYAGERLDLDVRDELIGVAGGEPRRLRVRSTRHGPLVSDVSTSFRRAGRGEYAVALRWTALTPGRSMDALFALNRARDWEEMRTAVSLFEVPAQNVVYADRTGRIGYQAPGKVPVRTGYDGRWPAEGWTGEQEWTGFADYDRMPRVVDPPEGFLVAANQAVVPPSYPVFLTDDWDAGYRADRIVERLAPLVDRGAVTTEQMLRLQRDQRSAIAPVLLPYLLDVNPGRDVGDAVEQLRRWDLRQDADSAGAAYFNAVWRHVLRLTFDDQVPKAERPDGGGRWMQVVTGLLDDPGNPWWDDVRTERREVRDGILTKALALAHEELADRLGGEPDAWRWGELHALSLESPTFGQSGIAPVEWLVNHGDVDVGGGESTVVATGWSSDEGYETDWVPSMRMVVDLADLDASRWVNLTGASGHAFHDNYTDQVDLWRDGRTTAWPFSQATVENAARHTLVLKP